MSHTYPPPPPQVINLLAKGANLYRPEKDGRSPAIFDFTESDLEKYLDSCVSYETDGKKISDCVLQFDCGFIKNRCNLESGKNAKIEEESENVSQKNQNQPNEQIVCDKNKANDEDMDMKGLSSTRHLKAPSPSKKPQPPPPPPPPPFPSSPSVQPTSWKVDMPKNDTVTTTTSKTSSLIERSGPETGLLQDIAAKHSNLLKHPLPRGFLMLKWRKINNVYKTWIVTKTVFLFVLTAVVLRNYLPRASQDCHGDTGVPLDFINSLLLSSLSLLLVIFIVVEILQCAVSIKTWVLETKNWLQFGVLLTSFYLTLDFWHILPGGCREQVNRQCIAFLMPLSYYEYLHELGCHPRFSKYILLFKRISIKFIKYTSIYIGLVVMSAVSFTVMLPKDAEDTPQTVQGSILNTILMFIGEVGIPPFAEEFYAIQAVFFLGFIFFLVIVLMNLLNALAVADAKELLEDAEMEMLRSLLKTVSFWENLLHGDPDNRLEWSLLPLASLASSRLWPDPQILAVLPPSGCLRLLPHCQRSWGEEFPCDFFWNLQEVLGWNRWRVRVQETENMWVEDIIVRAALRRTHQQESDARKDEALDTAGLLEAMERRLEKSLSGTVSRMDQRMENLVEAVQRASF